MNKSSQIINYADYTVITNVTKSSIEFNIVTAFNDVKLDKFPYDVTDNIKIIVINNYTSNLVNVYANTNFFNSIRNYQKKKFKLSNVYIVGSLEKKLEFVEIDFHHSNWDFKKFLPLLNVSIVKVKFIKVKTGKISLFFPARIIDFSESPRIDMYPIVNDVCNVLIIPTKVVFCKKTNLPAYKEFIMGNNFCK